MPDPRADVVRVDPEKLKSVVATYENAAFQVHRMLDDLTRRGRVEVPWTADEVSVEMAAHYNAQVFNGRFSTFAAISRYESELWAVTRTLRRMLDEYEKTEEEAVLGFRAARSTGGR
jgi:hypothetical protein